jgi:hypothetical protein
MTRYELFEAWLTTDEWKEWKIHSVKRFKQMYSLTTQAAREKRNQYLTTNITFVTENIHSVLDDWDDMTNRCLRWSDTAQGHSHWSHVNMRREPCRIIPPRTTTRIIHNVTI